MHSANFEPTIEGQTYTFKAFDMNGKKVHFNQIGDNSLLLEFPKDTSSVKIVTVLEKNNVEIELLEPVTIHLK